MENNYRGDTFWRSYEVEYENSPYTFQEGDVLKVAFYDFTEKAYLPKTIVVEQIQSKIDVIWEKEEMATLDNRQYILEVEITTKNFRKTYQEMIVVSKDYIVSDKAGDE